MHLAFAMFMGLTACGGAANSLSAGGTPMAEEAGKIAKEIAADPSKRAEVLAAHGADEPGLRLALYDIAGDATLTASYEAARQ